MGRYNSGLEKRESAGYPLQANTLDSRTRSVRPGFVRIGEHLRRSAAAYGVLLISLVLTALAFFYVRQNVEAQNRLRFDETTEATQEAIERRSTAYLASSRLLPPLPSPSIECLCPSRVMETLERASVSKGGLRSTPL